MPSSDPPATHVSQTEITQHHNPQAFPFTVSGCGCARTDAGEGVGAVLAVRHLPLGVKPPEPQELYGLDTGVAVRVHELPRALAMRVSVGSPGLRHLPLWGSRDRSCGNGAVEGDTPSHQGWQVHLGRWTVHIPEAGCGLRRQAQVRRCRDWPRGGRRCPSVSRRRRGVGGRVPTGTSTASRGGPSHQHMRRSAFRVGWPAAGRMAQRVALQDRRRRKRRRPLRHRALPAGQPR